MSALGYRNGRQTARTVILGSMGGERKHGGDGRGEHSAMPPLYREPEGRPDPDSIKTFVLEVDGEQFAVRVVVDRATGYTDAGYTWLSGPNKGYGFGTG